MTTVMRPADAPRAASHIISSSTRCSCTGLTSGWIRKTSRSRQLAWSCTSRQSLANRLTRVGLSGTPRWVQTSCASSGWALPLNTAMSRTIRSSHDHYGLRLMLLTRAPSPGHRCSVPGEEATIRSVVRQQRRPYGPARGLHRVAAELGRPGVEVGGAQPGGEGVDLEALPVERLRVQ